MLLCYEKIIELSFSLMDRVANLT